MAIPSVRVILTTGRTIGQGKAIESGKTSQEYIDSTAVCELHESVLQRIGVKNGELICVRTACGAVCVRARTNSQSERKDLAFMPVGPYANVLVGGDTAHLGMPDLKHIEAEVSRADGMVLKSPQELLSSIIMEG